MTITNQRIDITHSDADTMSIAKGVGAYSDASSSEIAFFLKGEWVVPPIEYFAAYHDGFTTTTAVYGWVPNELIESFLDKYADMSRWYGDSDDSDDSDDSPEYYWVTVDISWSERGEQ